ncbi:MAG: hypothetical protein M1834_000589 [Cirrosporium novae-zelandiae]|nr:MAG: hypothetical protein M1834_000589 [Cirrosporium novae-zelandiae]
MDEPESSSEQLLRIARERGISVDRQNIERLLNDPATQADTENWIRDQLKSESLLSKEEADLYAKLQTNGTADRIAASEELSATRPILDDDIRAAIQNLKASTAAIQKQNEALREQWKALDAFREKCKDVENQQSRKRAQRQKRATAERQRLTIAVEESATLLSSRLKTLQQQLTTAHASLLAGVEEELKGDDRLLHRLQKLAANLPLQDSTNTSLAEKTKKLSSKLAVLRVEEIKYRLDRIYLEESQNDMVSDSDSDEADIPSVIQEELDSLYAEIADVSEMAAEHMFEEPVTQEVNSKARLCQESARSTLDEVSSNIEHLTSKIAQQADRFQDLNEYSLALRTIFQASEEPLKDSSSIPQSLSVNSPMKGLAGSQTTSALSLESVEGLCGYVGLSLPEQMDEGVLFKDLVDAKRKQSSRRLHNLETTMRSSLSSSLGMADSSCQLLLGVLQAGASYRLVDPKDSREQEITNVEQQLDHVQKLADGLDLTVLEEGNEKQTRFVQKWAS